MGRHVRVVTKDGKEYRGVITHVDRKRVYLRPPGPRGFGYGYYGGYYGPGYGGFRPGYGAGLGLGIALGAIGAIALAPLFFW